MSLRTDRVRFTSYLAKLLVWISAQDWSYGHVEVALDEAAVHSPRLVRYQGRKVIAEDAVHKKDGFHPRGLAADILIYINGDYLEDGGHQIWKEIDDYCRTLDHAFGLGLSFNDSNHVSLGEANA